MPASPLFLHAVESFATYLRVERNLSPRTRDAYVYDLRRLAEWFTRTTGREKISLDAISTEHLQAYLGFLHDELMYKPATLNRVVSAIRVFFDFCVVEKLLEASPAKDMQRPRLPRKLPVYLVREELERLFGAPDRSTPAGRRDFAILVSLAYTGMRLQELVRLNTTDLDFARNTVRVFGKGSKERLIPLNLEVREALLVMLEDSGRVAAPGERAVFLNARGRRLTGRAVQYIVDRCVAAAGIDKRRISPHKLRHTFATLLYTRDVELVDIQSLMGHASLSSTQIYTHTNAGRLQAAIERLDFGIEE